MIREVLADGSIDRGGAFQSIPRPRVQTRLAEACAERVALIVAPAGYGKSVALNAYLESLRTPYVRYDVDASAGNLAGFVRGFVESVVDIAPTAVASIAEALGSVLSSPKPGAELAQWFFAHIKSFGGTFVIDDFHKSAEDPESVCFLTALVEKTKTRSKWLISSRSTLDLPVASWLAYGTSGMAVDEHDLKFSLDEARSAARSLRLSVRDDELVALLDLTNGWPTAVIFSLRSSTRSNDLRNIAATTREMIYRYLAEQVYQTLSEESREFLRDAALIQRLDVAVLHAMGYDRAEAMLEELRHAVAFISVDSPGNYRIHDLFRDFLDYESRMLGKECLRARLTRVADALQQMHRTDEALVLYRRAEEWTSIVRLIENVGFDLSARGGNETLESTIALLPNDLRTKNPTIVGLRAMFAADRQRITEAERLFRKALSFEIANDLRARFALSLNTLLTRTGNTGAIPLLEELHASDCGDATTRIDIASSLAMSYAIAGRHDDARAMISDCLDVLEDADDAGRARTMARLSVAHFYFPDYERVDQFATEGAALAAEIGLFTTASNCFSSLYATSSMRGDNTQALWFAHQMASSAVKAANKVLHNRALCSILDIESQRGNGERTEATLKQLSDLFGRDALNEPFAVLEALALQASWNGSFERGLQYLSQSLKHMFAPGKIAMRRSLMAVYCAALGRRDEAIEHLHYVGKFVDGADVPHDRLGDFAVVLGGLTNVLLGRATVAKKLLKANPPDTNAGLPFWRLVLLLAEGTLIDADDQIESDLRSLAEAGYGGYTMMIRNLPLMTKSSHSEDQLLTPTEQSVFVLLDRGMRPKAIAEMTGRSVNTVQNHIRAVISKLGTSGREEALVVARRHGLIDAKQASRF